MGMRKSQSPRLHLGASLSASASENPIHANQLGTVAVGAATGPQEEVTEVGPREREREREPDQRERESERKPEQAVKDSKAAAGPQGGDTRREEAGTRETEQGSHSPRNCSDCFALRECTRDNAFNARVNMLISPSHADAQAHSASTAASRAREETPVGGEREESLFSSTRGRRVGGEREESLFSSTRGRRVATSSVPK